MTEKTALIFGISGQDGAYLAHLLLSKGYRVFGSSRDAGANGFENLVRIGIRERVQAVSAATTDFRSVLSILDAIRPTEVYNLAGQSSVAMSFEQPIEAFDSIAVATLNILECIRFSRLPIRMFNAVSSECFGTTIEPATETTSFQPRSPYAMAKTTSYWATRNYREAYGMHVCSGILSNHDSPLRPPRFVCKKIVSAAVRIANGSQEKLQLGNVDIRRDWGLAAEYADAMWRMLQRPAADDYLIATGETNSLRDFLETAFAAVGLDAGEHVEINSKFYRPLELPESLLSPAKAEKDLGWVAKTKMRDLARLLVRCEIDGSVGPLPWTDH